MLFFKPPFFFEIVLQKTENFANLKPDFIQFPQSTFLQGSYKLPYGPDRLNRFVVDWIQTRQISNQTKLNQTESNRIELNQTKSNQIKSNQIKSNQIKSNQRNNFQNLRENDNPSCDTFLYLNLNSRKFCSRVKGTVSIILKYPNI